MNTVMVGELGLMITQNCNLKCAHCFRGEAEDINISDYTIENTFKKIGEIGVLILTGGEPLYSPTTLEIIKKIIESIKRNNIIVHSVRIITNGINYSDNIIDVLKDFYGLARCKQDSLLIISNDKYHVAEVERLNLLQTVLDNFDKYKKFATSIGIRFGTQAIDIPLKLGRANNLEDKIEEADIYTHTKMIKFIIDMDDFNVKEKYINSLEIHTSGAVYKYMISNDMVNDYALFNINDEGSLIDLLKKYYYKKYNIISKISIGSIAENRGRIRRKIENYRKN